jgi:hypothetical protein
MSLFEQLKANLVKDSTHDLLLSLDIDHQSFTDSPILAQLFPLPFPMLLIQPHLKILLLQLLLLPLNF